MRLDYLSVVCGIIAAFSLASCDGQSTANRASGVVYETDWPSQPGALAEWGAGEGYIFGVIGETPHLEVWEWEGDVLAKASVTLLPRSLDVVPISAQLCGMSVRPPSKGTPWPYAIVSTGDGHTVKKWNPPAGHGFDCAGGSASGKFIGIVAGERPEPPFWPKDHDFSDSRVKVGLIDVDKRELKWVAELTNKGAGTSIRRIVVTNDGRYVAVGGWANGVAMVDCHQAKVLWSKRPKDALSLGYVAFSPDSKTLYAGGGAGCAYSISVTTGDVLSRRYATKTGKRVYAHRISALAVSSDGEWVAAGTGPEGEVYVWNLKQNTGPYVLECLNGGMASVFVVTFSPDSKNIAAVSGGKLRIWRLSDLK